MAAKRDLDLPPNMMLRGSIYYVRIGIDGRDKWRSTGHTTLKSAIRRADEIKVQLRNDRDWKKVTVPTFKEWWLEYKKDFMPMKKRATVASQTHIIETYALPFFGTRRLDHITQTLCVKYLAKYRGEFSPWTLNLHHAVIAAVFEKAVNAEHLSKNPWKGIPRANTRSNKRQRVLSLEEEAQLRKVLPVYYDRWLTFMLGTGVRIEEATSVRVDDCTPLAVRVLGKGDKWRAIPTGYAPKVWEAVAAQIADPDPIYKGRHCEVTFPGQLWKGKPIRYRKALQRYAKQARIPHIYPHALRHTFATRYLQGGGDIYTLSRIMGHEDVAITQRHYAHLVTSDLERRSEGVELWANVATVAGDVAAVESAESLGVLAST